MGQVWVSTTSNGAVQQSQNLPREDVWTFHRSRHSSFLHQWPSTCYKRLLDITSYFPQRYVHRPPEGWAQSQRQKIMLWRQQIWLFGLSRHSWRGYAHTKENRGYSSPRSSKKLQTTASIYQYDQLLPWHVAKGIWDSCPIKCLNFQKRQIQLERRSQKVFWWYQTCDGTLIIVGLHRLQCSDWNTYWCFQTTNWCIHTPKGQAHRFLLTKDEQLPAELHNNWERTHFHSGNSQGVP